MTVFLQTVNIVHVDLRIQNLVAELTLALEVLFDAFYQSIFWVFLRVSP